ncbi:MAG: efflux RND transporter periplasmic adaptor subunit [Chloroflexi bacterium]|nr:efflux RND transporter periplasmic adaptor subunit [Chloroflexota bacterium]
MRVVRTAGALILLSIILTATSCNPFASTPKPAAEQTVTVTRGDLTLKVSGDGNISLTTTRKLAFGAGGKVAELNAEEGDRVKQGQVLARLDTTTIERTVKAAELGVKATELALKTEEADRQQAEDSIKTAEADVAQAQSSVKTAMIDLEQATDNFRKITYPYTYSTFVFDVPSAVVLMGEAKRQIAEAEAKLQIGLPAEQYYEVSRQLKDALDNLTRGRELLTRGQGEDVFQSGLIPVRDFWTLRTAQLQMDSARVAVENAQNTVSKTALSVNNARTALGKAQLDIDKAWNNMDTAKNELDRAKYELTKAVITAPFDGVAATVNIKKGDVISSVAFESTIAFEIIDPAHMELSADIDEIDIPGVKAGQSASISVDALPGTRLNGKVASIRMLSKEVSGVVYYTVKIAFDVPPGVEVKSGMSATADIITSQRNNVLLLPNRAVTQNSGGKPSVRVKNGAIIEEREIVTGLTDNILTEIVSGLGEGEIVVVEQPKPQAPGGFLFGG